MAGINANGGVSAPVDIPHATGGTVQPASPRGPKIVKVKAHTRTVAPRQPKAKVKVTQQQQPADPYAAAVQNAVDLKYGPQLDAVNQNVRNAQYAQVRSANWYHDYVNSLNANLAQQNAAANQLATSLNAYNPQAAQTGNPQADALAQQAQQSQHYLGQAFAGQQGQMALNTANQFATGLIPGANLQGQLVQQNLTNQIGQAQTQRGQLKSQSGEYGQQVKGQMQAASQKEADIQAALGIKSKTLDYLNNYRGAQVGIQQQNANTTRIRAKNDAALGQAKLNSTNKQNSVNNAIRVNQLALNAYMKAHPQLKSKGGGSTGFTPTQTRKAASTFRTLAGSLDEGQVRKDPYGAIQALTKGKKVDPLVANAVVESIINNGSVTRETAHTYFRATGHHLHVSPQAKHVSKNIGQIISGILQKLG